MKAAASSSFIVNGRSRRVTAADRRKSLLIYLREDLDLTGAKRGCGIGICGACTVLVDGGRGPGLYPGVSFRRTRPWIKATGEWRAEGSSLDGRPLRTCKARVADVLGRSLTTIEGLASPGGALHPLQQAFIDCGAIQCGYCTPGMVLTAHAFLLKHPEPTRADARKAIAGNLCRCTGYQQIIDAVLAAAPSYRKNKE